MSKQVPCVLLTQNAEVKQVRLPTPLTLDVVKQSLKKKESPSVLGTYVYKSSLYTLFGFTKGKAGTENKHELPPPLDSKLFFGDILIIASKKENDYKSPIPLTTAAYETFYTAMFGGFEDIEDESDESEDEEEVEAEVEEEEEEDEEEEDEEEEEEADAEAGEDFEGQEEVVVPVRATRVRAAKKKKQNNATLSATNSHIILDIPLGEHLQPDEGTALTTDSKRLDTIKTLTTVLNTVKGIDVPILERSIFNIAIAEAKKRHVTPHWTCKMFQYIYTTKIRHITGNLMPGSYIENKYLLNEVQKGKLQINEIAALSPYSMNNDLWKDYIHRQQQREKSQLEGNKAMATDQFLCGRCHKRECTYYEMQTRSADEPMTIFITCLNCGKHWRQ